MLESADVFAMPAIERLHSTRTTKIHDLLDPDRGQSAAPTGPAEAGLRYAVAHHMLEGAEHSGRAGNADAFAWYCNSAHDVVANLSTASAVGPRVAVAADVTDMQRSPISATPFLLLAPDTTPAQGDLRQLIQTAFTLGSQAGFKQLLSGHAAVVYLLRAKPLGATLDSWTISRLPGTIFVDHVGEPAILARDLIHEAGHNWLNDALAALEIKIDEEASFFSPWKDTHRPAFGFIHACWAFPLTMIYTAAALHHVTGAVRDYLGAYLRQQAALLAATAGDHERALDLLPDGELRGALRTVYQTAAALRP